MGDSFISRLLGVGGMFNGFGHNKFIFIVKRLCYKFNSVYFLGGFYAGFVASTAEGSGNC